MYLCFCVSVSGGHLAPRACVEFVTRPQTQPSNRSTLTPVVVVGIIIIIKRKTTRKKKLWSLFPFLLPNSLLDIIHEMYIPKCLHA